MGFDNIGLFGLGVEMGKGVYRQLFRMDTGSKDPKHKIKKGEFPIIEGDNFHMHVYEWGGKVW